MPCGECSGEKFAIDADRCLMLCVINVDMWLIVLFVIDIQHFDYDIEKSRKFRHNLTLIALKHC